ncbi:MAG: acetamidase/formamidase family protein [Phenylobacterium sp.]
MKRVPILPKALGLALALAVHSPAAAAPDLTGVWTLTSTMVEGSVSARLDLTRKGDAFAGQSGPLDPLQYCPLTYAGAVVGQELRLTVACRGQEVGTISLRPDRSGLAGQGRIFGTPVGLAAVRPSAAAPGAARTRVYDPIGYHPTNSAAPAPVMLVSPGETIRTRTIDPYGIDASGASVSMPGNPGTGPFYVEGALPGDTVAIRIKSLKPNRDTARMNAALDPAVLTPGYAPQPGAIRDVFWTLDPASGTARLRSPSDKLKDFRMPLRPMLGVVTVALPGGRAVPNREIGEWGGNLDYPEIREGVTLYLPVFQPGALIYLGDGHARQADGEVTGQGLETSMDVEFQVDVIKGPALGQPWAENLDYVMVSGIWGSLDGALRRATTGMAVWLKQTYRLDDSEVAAVMGAALEYDVAAVIGAQMHVVAKVRKDVLAQLPKP